MQILMTKRAGIWARRMRCLQLLTKEGAAEPALVKELCLINKCQYHNVLTVDERRDERPEQLARISASKKAARSWRQIFQATIHNDSSDRGMYTLPMKMLNGASQDLKRFLEQVGTNPKEARYWLKYYKKTTDLNSPFAVVQVCDDVFKNQEQLDSLGSCVAFLQRNNMKPVIVHGQRLRKEGEISTERLNDVRSQLSQDSMLLASILESHGAPARLLYSNVLQAHNQNCKLGEIDWINSDPIKWCLHSGHIPVINAIGESVSGHLLALDVTEVTEALARALKPTKVLIVNTNGGYTDQTGQVIANINLPVFVEVADKPVWCTEEIMIKVDRINSLLRDLPGHSSVVITSATTVLHELFTHHGCGTFFKIAEPVSKHTDLKSIDRVRLEKLINKSFEKDLKEDYFSMLEDRIHTVYLSEGYNAAAIITKDESLPVPYLDKFAVSLKSQGQGLSDILWELIQKDFPQIYWRSRSTNIINPWYFKHCEGSWSNGDWIVFWYGINEHRMTSELIDRALDLESSFQGSRDSQNGFSDVVDVPGDI